MTEEIAQAIVARLAASADVAAALGAPDAIYLDHPPQPEVLPCLVYNLQLIPGYKGVTGRLTLSAWARTASRVRRLMQPAADALLAGRIQAPHYTIRIPATLGADAGQDAGLRFERASFRVSAQGEEVNVDWTPTPEHALGGEAHTPDTLQALNAKVVNADLDDAGQPRDPNAHTHSGDDIDSGTVAEARIAGELTRDAEHGADPHTMTVDGRDVSVDGAKLDGVDAGADVTGDNPPAAHVLDGEKHTVSGLTAGHVLTATAAEAFAFAAAAGGNLGKVFSDTYEGNDADSRELDLGDDYDLVLIFPEESASHSLPHPAMAYAVQATYGIFCSAGDPYYNIHYSMAAGDPFLQGKMTGEDATKVKLGSDGDHGAGFNRNGWTYRILALKFASVETF